MFDIKERWKNKPWRFCRRILILRVGLLTAIVFFVAREASQLIELSRPKPSRDILTVTKVKKTVTENVGNESNARGIEATDTLTSVNAKQTTTNTILEFAAEKRPPPLWNVETRRRILQEVRTNNSGGVSMNPAFSRIRSVVIGNGDYSGIIEDDGRLVVSVTNDFALTSWDGGLNQRLCKLLRSMTLKATMDDNEDETTLPDAAILPTPLLNHTIDCEYVSRNFTQGQGNWVVVLYIVRMKAAKARVDYQFQCSTGRASELNLVMTWLEGFHPHHPNSTEWPYGGEEGGMPPIEREVCPTSYWDVHLEKFHLAIQKDLRRMAVRLVGPRAPEHEPYVTNNESTSFYPDLALDDVAIHFRCGDIFGKTSLTIYRALHFGEYVKWIRSSPPPQSIGILTQPFEKKRNRELDVDTVDDCRQATYALVDFLKRYYPSADIRIHNGLSETLPLAYARLIMAKQSFATSSTFSIFPIIATFGDGYFLEGPVHQFASPISKLLPNVHEIKGRYLTAKSIGELGVAMALEGLTLSTDW